MDLGQNTLQVVEIKEVRPKILWSPKKTAKTFGSRGNQRASGTEDRSAAFRNRKEATGFWAYFVRVLLADMHSRFGMIQVNLDAAQNFVIDDKLIAQLNDRPAFHIKRFLL